MSVSWSTDVRREIDCGRNDFMITNKPCQSVSHRIVPDNVPSTASAATQITVQRAIQAAVCIPPVLLCYCADMDNFFTDFTKNGKFMRHLHQLPLAGGRGGAAGVVLLL